VAAIVAVGQLLIDAKATVPHGEWARLFKDHPQAVARPIPVSQHTAELLMRIAKHPTLSNSTHGSNLPASWRTLYELTLLPVDVLEAYLALGAVHAELTRAEVIVLRGTPKPLPPPRVATSKGNGSLMRPAECDYEGVCRVEILQEDEVRLRQYATEIAAELAAPLRFSEAGRIVSGVWWLPSIPSRMVSRLPVHRCQCPACGHTHADQRAR
jgi:hypothetical protein